MNTYNIPMQLQYIKADTTRQNDSPKRQIITFCHYLAYDTFFQKLLGFSFIMNYLYEKIGTYSRPKSYQKQKQTKEIFLIGCINLITNLIHLIRGKKDRE